MDLIKIHHLINFMIVLSHQQGWKIITQRSHGLLAGMLAYEYDIDLPLEIMLPTLVSIAEHDDGVMEMLAPQNLTDAGAPRSFVVADCNNKTDINPMLSLMEIAKSKSRLNGLLTSLHIKFLYDSEKRNTDKVLDKFLKDLEKYRTRVLKDLQIDKAYENKLSRFLEWGDAFSLLICLNKIQPGGKKMEISQSPDGIINTVHYKPNKEICVEPWPFKSQSFKVFYEYKIIKQLQFKSIEEFNDVYKTAKIKQDTYTLSK